MQSFPFNPLEGDSIFPNEEIGDPNNPEKFSLPKNNYKLNFPPLKPYKYPKSEIAININESSSVSMKNLRGEIIKNFEKTHHFWDCPLPQQINTKTYYKFYLPPSSLESEGNIDAISLPQYKFHSERTRLKSKQLKEIWEKRTFKVPSEMENLPHLWCISKWLLHSSKERTQFFKGTLAICLRLFYAIPNVVNPFSDRVIRIDIIESITKPNIFNVFINFFAFFLNLFDFFFGFKYRTLYHYYESDANSNVFKKTFHKLTENKEKFQETFNLVESLTSKEDNKNIKEKLLKMSTIFNQKFEEDLKNEINKEDFEDEEIESIRFSIEETKQEKLYEFLENMAQNNDSPIILPSLIKKIKALNIFRRLSQEKTEEINNKRTEISEKIQKTKPIFYLIGYKRNRLIEKLLSPIKEKIEADFNAKIENELSKEGLFEEIELFKNYQQYLSIKNNLISDEISEMKKFLLKPVNKFTIKYPLFASQYKKVYHSNPNYWSLKTEDSVSIHSNFMFYKVMKALASYFIKLYSLMFKIFKWIWQGPFGIKCFCLCSEFYRDYSIDKDGNIHKNCNKVRPILRCFLGVLHGIQKSRKRFEDEPDEGFFGKNFGRIINILYCILIRFIFAGIIIVLILHPIINILAIIGGILSAITTFVWLVVVEITLLTWKLLIYDYKSTLRHHSYKFYDQNVQFFEHKFLKLLRSYKWFTLLHLTFDFLINVIFQLFMVIIMVIFAPLISILVFIVGLLLYILKCIWDWFILNVIVRCFARIPSQDSTFAYRISGPGISRDFYNTLETNDLSLLVIAHLERLELDQIYKEGEEILEYPRKAITKQYETLFHKFTNDSSNNEFIKESFKNVQFLKDSLRNLINEKKGKLPRILQGHHTIRFMKEELEKNEILVEGILKEIITTKKMDYYVWDLYELKQGLYKRLTRKVLQQILSPHAIKPVEVIDHIERVKFANKNTSINNFISKLISDDNENFKKSKEKRAYLQEIRQKMDSGKRKIFVSINCAVGIYSKSYCSYDHPFDFIIVNKEAIKNWNPNSNKENENMHSNINIEI